MFTATFHDVNEAYTELQIAAKVLGNWEETRNGEALVFQGPVLIAHASPYRRVLFDAVRDANPFFHYMEAIWMLTGSEEVDFPAYFAKNIRNYSDDGTTLHGAYGYRWRDHFDFDQLDVVIEELKRNPNTRRAVLTMWDPVSDLGRNSKDLPCNTHIYFAIRNGQLNMTVCNRSNDLVWGMLGANMVHMSILQEYVAGAVNVDVGTYYQFTNNLHVYKGWEDKFDRAPVRWYTANPGFPRWAFNPTNFNLAEAERFVIEALDPEFSAPFSSRIIARNAEPMLLSYRAYKSGNHDLAEHHAKNIYDADWQVACLRWLARHR